MTLSQESLGNLSESPARGEFRDPGRQRTRNRPRRRYGARYPCERSAVRTRSPSEIGLE